MSSLQNINLSLCGNSRDDSVIIFIYRTTTSLVSRWKNYACALKGSAEVYWYLEN